MRFKLTNFLEYYKICETYYSIEVYVPLSEHDFYIIVEKLKYYCRKNHISWLAVFSDTDSKDAEQVIDRVGKVGRPKKRVKGTKVDGHTHITLVGSESHSGYKTACIIKQSIDKKYKKKVSRVVSKGDFEHGHNFIRYSLRQANIVRTGGDFNFRSIELFS